MNVPQVYAIAAGGVFVLLLIIKSVSAVQQILRAFAILVAKRLTYPFLVRRRRLLGPWSRADVILQVIYLTINILCLTFRVSSVKEAGARAGTLAMINMAPLFFGFHLSFLADILGISLSNFRRIHRMMGWMSLLLGLVHALVVVHGDPSFLRDMPKNLYAVIAGSCLGLLMLLSVPVFRKPSYEFFLRTHQVLAFTCAYALWRHLSSKSLVVRICLYTSTGMFGLTSLLQVCSVLYCNVSFQRGFPRARVTKMSSGIKVTIMVPSRLQIKPGQYINLWIPSISFWSFLQSHPFVVASCADGEQTTLELLIGPQKGLTSKYLRNSINISGSASADLCLALFSGPHGLSAPLADFETVLLVASGLGIATQLPYLRHLIRGYNDFQVRTRRIHLVWQLESLEDGALAQDLLNQALKEDTLDNGYILTISVYYASGNAKRGLLKEGQHRRVSLHPGLMNLADLLHAEVAGVGSPATSREEQEHSYDEKTLVQEELVGTGPNVSAELDPGQSRAGKKGGRMLVTVSASNDVRDNLRELVRTYLDESVSLLELEYQP